MKNVTHAFNLPIKLVFLCQSVARQTSRYLCSNWFLPQPPTCSHTPPTLVKPVQSSSRAALHKTWLKRLEWAFLKLRWGLNGSSELGSVASEGASLRVPPPSPSSPCVVLLPHMSEPMTKALARLLLLLPCPLYALPPCSHSPHTFFPPCAAHDDFSFPSLWHYFSLVLLQHPVVCVPLSCSSVHDHKRVVQSTYSIFSTFDTAKKKKKARGRNNEWAYGQHIWNYNYW